MRIAGEKAVRSWSISTGEDSNDGGPRSWITFANGGPTLSSGVRPHEPVREGPGSAKALSGGGRDGGRS